MRVKVLLPLLALVLSLVTISQVYAASEGSTFLVSVKYDANHRYLPGEILTVTLNGENNGIATFDVGEIAKALPMSEVTPGIYVGSYQLPKDAIIDGADIVGHLQKGDRNEMQTAPVKLSTGPVKEVVTKINPDNGSVITLDPPSISFKHKTIEFSSLSTVRVYLDGQDITTFCTISQDTVIYHPSSLLLLGNHHLKVIFTDSISRHLTFNLWFTVERESAATNQQPMTQDQLQNSLPAPIPQQ